MRTIACSFAIALAGCSFGIDGVAPLGGADGSSEEGGPTLDLLAADGSRDGAPLGDDLAPRDLAGTDGSLDLTTLDAPMLDGATDLTALDGAPPDLVKTDASPDLTVAPDLTVPPDLTVLPDLTVPPDLTAPPDLTCTAPSCNGSTLVQCSGAMTTCPLGCSTSGGAHCEQIYPTGGAVTSSDLMRSGVSAVTVGMATIDTVAGTISGVTANQFSFHVTNGVGVFVFNGLTLNGKLSVTGSNGLALVSEGDITVNAVIDATTVCANGTTPPGGGGGGAGGSSGGTGGGQGGGQGGAGQADNSSGGAGGGYGAAGGVGGKSASHGNTTAGSTYGDPTIATLVGGSGGGGGGGNGGKGGGGGAAIQLVASGTITFASGGGVNAGGCGGAGGGDAGGGGGSGGAILVEAPTVAIDSNATLAVNGGGGGGSDGGGAGQAGQLSASQATGGTPGGGSHPATGGKGGASGNLVGAAGGNAGNGAGGGGGVGRLRINVVGSQASVNGTLSPNLTEANTTATQGPLDVH